MATNHDHEDAEIGPRTAARRSPSSVAATGYETHPCQLRYTRRKAVDGR